MAAWTVAGSVMIINGYLLFDFFKSEISGLFLGSVVILVTAAYLAFILYMVSRDEAVSSWLTRLLPCKLMTNGV